VAAELADPVDDDDRPAAAPEAVSACSVQFTQIDVANKSEPPGARGDRIGEVQV
jgi:hypothetical protein